MEMENQTPNEERFAKVQGVVGNAKGARYDAHTPLPPAPFVMDA